MTKTLSVLLLGLLLTGANAMAQVSAANVIGTITDETGAVLPGVAVTAENLSSGKQSLAVTGSEGRYRLTALDPGPYKLTAVLAGFATQVHDLLTLRVGTEIAVDFRLTVTQLEETLTVVGSAPVDTTQSRLSSVVTPDHIEALPLLDRNFLGLAQLVPGAGPDNSPNQRFNQVKFGGGADQRSSFSTIVDGGDIDDAIWGYALMNFTEDAIQEFNVLRNRFDSEYGNAPTAIVTVITKAGTNELRGNGFYFGRDRRLNATNAFATTKPPFDQQRYGGTIGGPIVENKTHFFGAYEYNNRDTVRIFALPATNPFAARENGIFPSGLNEHLVDFKVSHQISPSHSGFVRYAFNKQFILRSPGAQSSPTNTIDDFNRAHSIVVQETWVVSPAKVNVARVHYVKQDTGNEPHSRDINVVRPSVTTGQATQSPQSFPRSRYQFYDTFYWNGENHAIKFGGVWSHWIAGFDASFFEHGAATFTTDREFNLNDQTTWPIRFEQGLPVADTYISNQAAAFINDDWSIRSNLTVNMGLRFDIDTNLRDNSYYDTLFEDPGFRGVENFISRNRGHDWSNVQPRLGAVWDPSGNARFVMRGGWGIYSGRPRPWIQQFARITDKGSRVVIEDPNLLRNFPNATAMLGGADLKGLIASGGPRALELVADDFKLPKSQNSTIGFAWQLHAATSLAIDYVHNYEYDQWGGTDYNLPASGRIGPTNPRPVSRFTAVVIDENYTKAWYDSLQTQLQTKVRSGFLNVSYSLSRAYRDGVDFYNRQRGTQRTPQERGLSETNQKHNLTVGASAPLPGGFQFSTILKLVSGGPIRVQAGVDLDGDLSITGDRPVGVPITVGGPADEGLLQIINDFRTTRGLPGITMEELTRRDPFYTLDARLSKFIQFSDARRLELVFEGFNILNHINYIPFGVNGSMNSRAFLQRSSAFDARQIQWGAKFYF